MPKNNKTKICPPKTGGNAKVGWDVHLLILSMLVAVFIIFVLIPEYSYSRDLPCDTTQLKIEK